NVNWPVPGMSRTRTMASLRRPTIGAGGKLVINVLELLGDLLDLERLRLLGLVRVMRAGVDLQLLQLLTTQRVLGQHSLDSELHYSLRLGFQQLPDCPLRQATRVARVPVPELVALGPRQRHLLRVDDHDEVARVDMRRELRLVLSAQQRGGVRGQPAEYRGVGVDHVPPARYLA